MTVQTSQTKARCWACRDVEALPSVIDSHIVYQVIVALPNIISYRDICRVTRICGGCDVNIFIPADVIALAKMIENKVIVELGRASLSPVFIIVRVLIKIGCPGPVLFRQMRYGHRLG